MMKTFLAVGAAAVALAAAPADAARHYARHAACMRHHHGRCVAWHRMTRARAIRVGYMFGPSFAYTDYLALPAPVVTRYRLRRNFRYVERNGFVYVVNPRTYRVVRIIPGG